MSTRTRSLSSFAVQQELALAVGLEHVVGGVGQVGRDVHADQPGLAVLEADVCLLDLDLGLTEGP